MADAPRNDASLLSQFLQNQDEAAFGELVRRHGPLVWGVCRRRLDRLEDAEDAFQTTFLILAIKSAAIHRPEALGSWLHRTAARVARRVATQQPRAPVQEPPDAGLDALAEITRREMIAAVDEELQSLPQRYREAIVLFHLEGLARCDVADQLGLSEQTVKARLSRGRSLLRTRLARRGVALPLLLPLAVDPLPAGAAESATRLGSTFGRTRITPGDLLTTTITQGANPMLSLITGKAGMAVLAICVGLTIVWAVREPLRAGDGEESRESGIETTLQSELPRVEPVAVAMFENGEGKKEKEEELLATPTEELATEKANEEVRIEGGDSFGPLGGNPGPEVKTMNPKEAPEKAEAESPLAPATASAQPTKRSPQRYAIPTNPAQRNILDELDKPTRMEFAGIPLRNALQNLARQHEINIVFEEEVIEEEGLSLDENIDLFLNGVSLRSALDLILTEAGLTYGLDNEVLVITTETAAANRVVTRAYQVPPNTGTSPETSFGERLKELLLARRETDGYEPTIDVFQDRLLVVAPLEDHKHLREILRLIYMDIEPGFSGNEEPMESTRSKAAAIDSPVEKTDAELLKTLDEIIHRVDYTGNIPLSVALEHLSHRHIFNLDINEEAIEAAGLSVDEETDIFLDEITVRSALDILLEPAGLGFAVQDGVVHILPSENRLTLAFQPTIRLYPVDEFAVGDDRKRFAHKIERTLRAEHAPIKVATATSQIDVLMPQIPVADVVGEFVVVVGSESDHDMIEAMKLTSNDAEK